MNCSRLETLLSDYIEDQLDPRVRAAVRQHLLVCIDCSALVQQVESLRMELADLPEVELPAELVDRIVEKTTGKFHVRSLWTDLVIPTLRPFLSRRFAFATAIMFVFLSLMVNVIGPDFSAFSFSDLRPSALVEQADRVSSQVYKRWIQVKNGRDRVVGEVWRLKEDLYGRLDYHLINLMLRNYQHQAVDQEAPKPERQERKD
jgi:anti-sigma factor RsiW